MFARAKAILEPPDTIHLRLDGEVLEVTGAAPHQWIDAVQRLARVVPGAMHVRTEQVVDLTLRELLALKETIEQSVLYFVKDTTRLVPGQEEVLRSLSLTTQQLFRVARQAGQAVQLHIIGHTDKTGSEERNRPLSQERAERILTVLTAEDIVGTHVRAIGIGSREPLREGTLASNGATNRRVTLRVALPEMSGR